MRVPSTRGENWQGRRASAENTCFCSGMEPRRGRSGTGERQISLRDSQEDAEEIRAAARLVVAHHDIENAVAIEIGESQEAWKHVARVELFARRERAVPRAEQHRDRAVAPGLPPDDEIEDPVAIHVANGNRRG